MKRPSDETLLRKTALRIVKNVPGFYGMPKLECSADFYCAVLDGEKYCYETEDEFVFCVEHLLLTDACIVTASFKADGQWEPAAILCEGRRLVIEKRGDKFAFSFEISGLTGGTRTLYVHTLLRRPGLTVRIEQNSPGRRAGVYRSGEYPATEIEAASHYIFAVRRILDKLGVPQYLSENELGYILLLSFETYNQIHGDYPPHWHLIFRWPERCGSPAPHIYMDSQGRMIRNVMYIDMLPNVTYTYKPLEWCPFTDKYGRTLMSCRIEEDGGMSIKREGRSIYTVTAYREGAVNLLEDGKYIGSLQVKNDVINGKMEIIWRNEAGRTETEIVSYDPLTGSTTEYISGT